MAAILIVLAVCEVVGGVVLAALPHSVWIGTLLHVLVGFDMKLIANADGNNPAPGVYICADGDPAGDHRTAYSWIGILTGESILVCLSLYKGWQDRRTGYGSDTLRMLTRESVFYFVAYVRQTSSCESGTHSSCRIFWIYMLNQVMWAIDIVGLISRP